MCLVFLGRGGGLGGRGGRGGGFGGGKYLILIIVNCNFEICLNIIFYFIIVLLFKKRVIV